MTKRVSAREARANFAELTERVRHTGEPVIVEKQGKPCVAVIAADDLELLEQLRFEQRERRLERRLAEAAAAVAAEYGEEIPTDDEIVAAVRKTRRETFRERYGDR